MYVCTCACVEIVAAEPGIKLEAEQVDFSGVGLLTEAYTPDLRYYILLGVWGVGGGGGGV